MGRVLAAPHPAAQLMELERPYRSAPSTSITVALATSIPTSITLVATSTAVFPDAKRSIAACFSRAAI